MVETNPLVRDRLWIWTHAAGSHNNILNLPTTSRMTPAEGAFYMNIPNLIHVVYEDKPEPPYDRYLVALRPLDQVVWSIIGDSSSKRNDQKSDIDEVLHLAKKFPNITGAMMDDFFHQPDSTGSFSRVSVEQLANFRGQLHQGPHPLDLWVVLYQHDLNLPVTPYLDQCDVVTFWTWKPELLNDLDKNLERAKALAPDKRLVLGCYMWNYNDAKPIPLDLMQYQCEKGLAWLKEGKIAGMIFLASCICDLELEAVEWTRQWISQVGNHAL